MENVKMNLKSLLPLVQDGNGKLSHTVVWSNIGYFVYTLGFVYMVGHSQSTEYIWMIYGVTVIGSRSLNKFMEMRHTQILDKPSSVSKKSDKDDVNG
jgi:hypothetical protein